MDKEKKYIQWDDPKDWMIGKKGEDEVSFISGYFFGVLSVVLFVLIITFL